LTPSEKRERACSGLRTLDRARAFLGMKIFRGSSGAVGQCRSEEKRLKMRKVDSRAFARVQFPQERAGSKMGYPSTRTGYYNCVYPYYKLYGDGVYEPAVRYCIL
jgi:hypothetical protein